MSKIIVISDLHAGHKVGLTPADWQKKSDKFYDEQCFLYDFYLEQINKIGAVDVVIVNGDAIDGKGEKSGGTELLTSDRDEQVEMAYQCLKEIKAKEFYFTFGSPYHVGKEEDWEKVLAEKMNSEIKSHLFLNIDGLTFDIKHKINSSIIPHGRYTAIARDKLWNSIWAENEGQPLSDIIIRSHVHYFNFCGDDSFLAIITPAMQGIGSKFGARQCSGIVKTGFIYFETFGDKEYTWRPIILKYKNEIKNQVINIGYKDI